MYQARTYRNLIYESELVAFRQAVQETDLYIHAVQPLEDITREAILRYRGYIEAYIRRFPDFVHTLKPWHMSGPAPAIVRDMVTAGLKAGVGPMAAVAGAIAERVGVDLLRHTEQVVVENGGDVFLKTNGPITIGIFAGDSPLSLRVGLRIQPGDAPVSVCTSSGTVGHSLSLGKADAVSVVSMSCAIADAAATSVGNHVNSPEDIQKAIKFGKSIEGVIGLIIISGDKIGFWGDLELVPLSSNFT